jgi:hypothetical protein
VRARPGELNMKSTQAGRCVHALMPEICTWLVIIVWLHLFQGNTLASELSSANVALKALRTDLLNGSIVRVDILFVPYGLQTHSPVKPDMVEYYACPRIGAELSARLVKELANWIDGTILYEPASQPDLRWGAIFFEKSERPIHSIYLNGPLGWLRAGRLGYVDGTPVGVNSFLIYWLESNFLSRAACSK